MWVPHPALSFSWLVKLQCPSDGPKDAGIPPHKLIMVQSEVKVTGSHSLSLRACACVCVRVCFLLRLSLTLWWRVILSGRCFWFRVCVSILYRASLTELEGRGVKSLNTRHTNTSCLCVCLWRDQWQRMCLVFKPRTVFAWYCFSFCLFTRKTFTFWAVIKIALQVGCVWSQDVFGCSARVFIVHA